MRLLVSEEITDLNGKTRTVYKHNRKVDYIAPCSNPNCKEIGTRSQYGRDEICWKCGSPFDWGRETRWNYGL